MQFDAQPKPPVGVVFDSDLGARIDTVLALALLYGFDGKNEARVISLSTSRPSLASAKLYDVLARFYSSAPTTGPFAGFSRMLPVGMSGDGAAPDTPVLKVVSKFPNSTIHEVNDTAEPAALIRNALTSQYDQNAIVILAGPATNLVKTLELRGAKDLIASKVRYLSISGAADLEADPAASKKLLANWPTPIYTAGKDTGDAILFPASSIEKDFAWSTQHPVVEAYKAYKPMPYDAPTWDMAAVLYAIRPKEGYFKLAGKNLAYDPDQKDRIVKLYTELASAKPVVRQRFRPPKKEDEKKDEPKKP